MMPLPEFTMAARRKLLMLSALAVLLIWLPKSNAGVILTNLYSFDGSAGQAPQCTLALGTNGVFYGTTPVGGAGGLGTVFTMTHDGAVTNIVNFFGTNGASPYAGLTLGTNGDFYGVCGKGGIFDTGTVFRVSPAGVMTMLVSLNGTNGSFPTAELVQAKDGNFYGTTEGGGASGNGTIFKMSAEGDLTTLYSFSTNGGYCPESPLLQVADGSFYGTTACGGASNTGSIYQIGTDGSVRFLAYIPWPYDNPIGRLLEGPDGALYGVVLGYRYGHGMVFRVTTKGELTILVTFEGSGTNGLFPALGLTRASDGNLYGTCAMGGTYDCGVVYRIEPQGSCTTVYTFTGSGDGAAPVCELIQAGDGNLYGTTEYGGTNHYGSIFRLSVPMPPLLGVPQVRNGHVGLNWTAVAEQSYQLEFSADLTSNSWSAIGPSVVATNGMAFMDDTEHSPQTGFYRVVLVQ